MDKLSLETLPIAFTQLTTEVGEIKHLLKKLTNQGALETGFWFDLNEFCKYHPDKPAKATVYGWVSAGSVPFHKTGKKLRFLRSEIDAWLSQGRRKTATEIEEESYQYLKKRKGGDSNE